MPDLPAWIPLWSGGAPLARGLSEHDTPAVRHFSPDGPPNGAAMVVLPGGGYGMLAAHEGEGYCRWLAGLGYQAFEVRYRLGSQGYRHPAMWLDASRAVRIVRARAEWLGFHPHRIGIMGSSAGGHLAAHVSVHHDGGDPAAKDPVDRVASRPDLAVLCYPVISMTAPHLHAGSRANLLGENPDPAVCEQVSPDLQVTAETPPCFVWHTVEDRGVPIEHSVEFTLALRRAGVPFELHLYTKGPHGIGLADGHPWTVECARWLTETFGA